jgi:hypothetical protein
MTAIMKNREFSPIFGSSFFYSHFPDEAAFFRRLVWVVVDCYLFAESLVGMD